MNYLGDYLLLVVLIFNQVEEPAEFMVHKVHLSRRCAMSSGVLVIFISNEHYPIWKVASHYRLQLVVDLLDLDHRDEIFLLPHLRLPDDVAHEQHIETDEHNVLIINMSLIANTYRFY